MAGAPGVGSAAGLAPWSSYSAVQYMYRQYRGRQYI